MVARECNPLWLALTLKLSIRDWGIEMHHHFDSIQEMETGISNRKILIRGESESGEMYYDSSKIKDSEALHHVLCLMHPGDNYIVEFIPVYELED